MAQPLRVPGTLVRTLTDGILPIARLFRRTLFLAGALLLWNAEAKATHAMGGDLRYTCLGNNQYRVTLTFYRDCNGIDAPNSCSNGELSFLVESSQCGVSFTDCFANNPTVEIITPICPSEIDRCNSTSGTYGVQRYTYTKVINLTPFANCNGTGGTDWVISWSLCCRNNAITALNNPGQQDLYVSARLNKGAGICNTSPTFTNAPTPFYCLGQPISYNPGAVDPNGDSLAYALIGARGSGGAALTYNTGYSATQPIRNSGGANAVVLNPSTGTMTVTPSVQQVAVVTYRVTEYRNGVVVGEITRDVQFVVRACTGNNAPTATGINGTNVYSTQVCAGTPITFTVNSNDVNAGQVVTMTWNSGIAGATFTTAGSPFPTGTFSWTPTVANIGTNVFTVNVKDNGCPLVGTNDFGFSVLVTPPATNADAGPDQSVCATSATLAGVLPFVNVQGTWSVVSGAGTFANVNSPTTNVTGLAQGANVFRWTVNYQTCGTRTDDVTITRFNPAQAAASAGPNQSLCLPATTTNLAGNTATAPAVGTWTLVGGTGTITAPNSPTSSVTGLGVGVNRFRWTINNGPCGTPTQSEMTITVFSNLQGAANAGPDQSICTPANSVTMSGNSLIAPATGTWTVVSGGGTITTAGSPTTTITGLPVGVHVFRWTITNGPCTPPTTSDDVTVTVFSASSPNANAGANQQVCLPSGVTLAGNAPTFPATGLWTLVSGSGTITTPASPTSTVTGLAAGANVFQWTLSNGPCANGVTTAQVTITAFDPTISGASAGPDQSLCTPNTTATMAANVPSSPATGTWTLVSGSGTITSTNSPSTTITGLAVGENVFRWALSNGPCPLNPPSDLVSIFIFDANAPVANAGPAQQLCTPASTTTLAGNTPTFPATGEWTRVSGTGTITNPVSPTSGVTGLTVGTNVFRWTITNGPCANPVSTSTVSIVVFNAANPVANAGPDQDLCTPTTSATLNGSTLITPATGMWTLVSGTGTIVSPNSPSTQVTGLGTGNNVFRWTVSNGPCANGLTTDDIRIRVFDANNPIANAGPDQNLCSNAASTTMAASSIIFPATGTWTLVSGTGAIASPNSPSTTITGLAVGENVFRWSVSNGPCANSNTNDLVSIFVYSNAHPAVTVGANQDICVPTTPNTVTVTGTTPVFPATGQWTLVSGAGTIASPNNPTTAISGMAFGPNVFRWTINNGPCTFPSNSATLTIRVFDAATPPANAGPDQALCTPITSATLAGSALLGPAAGTWTLVSGTGTFANANSPGTTVSGLSLGNNVFRWSVNNGPCSSVTTDDVTIALFNGSAQQPNAGPDQQLCDNAPSTTLAANAVTLPATASWSVVQGTATFTNANSPTSGVSGLSVGVNILVWSINNGACGTAADQVSITVFDDANPVANAGPDQNLCTPTTSTTMAGSSLIAPATGTWTLVSGSGNIVNPTSPTTGITGLAVGNNVFRWSVSNGPCVNGSTNDLVTITVFNNAAQAANAGPDQQVCTPTTSVTLAGNAATTPGVGTWTRIAGGGTFTNANQANTTVNGLQVGANTFAWAIANGPCGTTTDQVTIYVFDANNPVADAGDDQQLCFPNSSAVMAGSSLTFPATGTWTLVSGTGTIVNPNSPTTSIVGLTIGVNTFRWTVSNGPCANPITTDEVSVVVFDPTISGSTAGPDQELCTPNTMAIMAGNVPVFPATGTWTLVSGTGTITDPSSPTTTITGLGVGQNTFRWSLSNGPCPLNPPNDVVSIFVFDANNPVANAGPDQELCTPNTSTTFAGSSLIFPATGTWTRISGTGTITAPNSPTSGVSGLSVGENIFEWTVSNGPCANPLTADRVSLFVFDVNAPVAAAGPDQDLCTPNTSTTLAGNTPTFPAAGTWTLVSGGGTLTDPNDPLTTITDLPVGENIFRWSIDNGPCANPVTTDDVRIRVFDSNAPTAAAGPDQELCTPASSATMAGSAVTFPAAGTWTRISGTGTITAPNNPTTTITGLSVGANVFRWTVDNGPCASGITTDEVTVFVFDAANPVAAAGPDQDLCTPASTATMAGSSLIFPATGTWTVITGSATITDPSSPTTAISDLPVGTHLLVWTVDNGPCGPLTTDTVQVRVFDAANPAAGAGPDQDLCTPTTSATLVGSSFIAPSTGIWTVVQGGGTFADASSPTTTVSNLPVGVNILRWTVDNGPCEGSGSFDEVTITLYDQGNPTADAGPDQEICTPASSVTLAGSAIIFPAQGTWTVISGTATITDVNDPNTTVTDLEVGETVLEWTVTNGPCTDPLTSNQMTILVYDNTVPVANAGNNQQVCTPLTGTTLAGSSITFPATGTWTLVSGAGTITDPSDPASPVTDLGVGENVFRWTVDNGPCAAGTTTDEVSIFLFDLNAPPAAAGTDQSFCTPTSATTLAGNTPTGAAIGVWTVAQGTGAFDDLNDPTTDVTGLTVGENILTWSIDNGICGISHDNVSIFIYDEHNPPAAAGLDQEFCMPHDSTFLAGNVPTFPAEGTWSVIGGSGLFEDANDPATKVLGLAIGENTYVWTMNNGPCPNAITADTMVVTLYSDSTAAAYAGEDLDVCFPLTSVGLDAAEPQLPAVGSWSLLSGTGTIVDSFDRQTLVENLEVGVSYFVWTLDNGPCPDNGLLTDTVMVTVYNPFGPVAQAGPDQELCSPTESTTLTGSIPQFPSVGTWTLISGTGAITDEHDPVSTVTGLTVGESVFVWSIFTGNCGIGAPTTDTLSVFVFDVNAPAANAGKDVSQCTPNTTVTLGANSAVFPGAGLWTIHSGVGSFSDPTDPTTAVTDLGVGDNVLVWTIDNGACGTTSDTLHILIYDQGAPAPDAGPDQALCAATTATLAGNAAVFPGFGTWSVESGPGVVTDVNDPASGITGLAIGTNVFRWTIDNGPCGTASNDVTITIYDDAITTSNAGPDQVLCGSKSTTLAANAVTAPATAGWMIVSGTGTLSDPADAAAGLSGLTSGEVVLVWTIDNGPCALTQAADTVVITIYPVQPQTADAGPDQPFCEPRPIDVEMFANQAVFPAVGQWSIVEGTGTPANTGDENTTFAGVDFGTSTYRWTIDNGVCGNSEDDITVQVFNSTVPAADGGPDQAFCQDTTTTRMAAVPVFSTAVGAWSRLSGHGDLNDATAANTAVDDLEGGVNIFLWTVANGACGTTSDSVVITLRDCSTLIVPDAFSPNGDGVNDTYVIRGLEYYPNNTFQVFNRWGNKVLERKPYTNTWDGRSEGDMNWGEELPESTYYFILDPGNDKDVITGYIYLRR